jgi:hypothetical protein
MSPADEWPPLHWKLLGFLGGLCLMLNHFHDQGIRYHGSEVFLRTVAIRITPVLLGTAGLLAIWHARRAFAVRHLVGSALAWCAIAFVPLVLLEMGLFPTGHGASEGLFVALFHLPFVGVFLGGLWCATKLHPGTRRRLEIWLPAPAGWLFGSAIVYAIVFARRVGFHWERCQDAGGSWAFLKCFF